MNLSLPTILYGKPPTVHFNGLNQRYRRVNKTIHLRLSNLVRYFPFFFFGLEPCLFSWGWFPSCPDFFDESLVLVMLSDGVMATSCLDLAHAFHFFDSTSDKLIKSETVTP